MSSLRHVSLKLCADMLIIQCKYPKLIYLYFDTYYISLVGCALYHFYDPISTFAIQVSEVIFAAFIYSTVSMDYTSVIKIRADSSLLVLPISCIYDTTMEFMSDFQCNRIQHGKRSCIVVLGRGCGTLKDYDIYESREVSLH